MHLQVLLKPGEDGWIVAECPALPGCVSQGKNREEALANIQEAILGWLEAEETEAGELASARQHDVAIVEIAA